MTRIIILDLERENPTSNSIEHISFLELGIIHGGKNKDFYYLLNYMAAGLAISSIRAIVDWFD